MTYRTAPEPSPHREPIVLDETEVKEAIKRWIMAAIPNRNKIITNVELRFDPEAVDAPFSAKVRWTVEDAT